MVYIKLLLIFSFSESLNVTLHPKVGLKRNRTSESSSFLWHKRLGYISRERVNLLVKEEILPGLDFTDFEVCIDCIKGKQTKHTRSTELLEIVHTDI